MMQQETIVQKLRINRIGERIHFQICLPRDTNSVAGLEYHTRKLFGQVMDGVFPITPEGDMNFRRFRNKVIGKLSLQNSGCENLFYQGDLIENRNAEQYEKIAALLYTPQEWIQGRKREEISLSVGGGMIEGVFQDSYGVDEFTELQYELYLYLWIQKCT
jgi:hypothetical protein